jgi:hypothetical protein
MKQFKTNYQRGAALLLIVAALIMSAAWMSYELMGGLGQKLKRQNSQEVAQALAEAKENLLVFASMQPEIYANTDITQVSGVGYLPAPDFDNDGRMGIGLANLNTNTSALNVIGLLPSVKDGTVSSGVGYFSFRIRNGCQQSTPDSCTRESNMIWYAMSGRTNSPGDLRLTSRRTGTNTRALNSNTLRSELLVDTSGNALSAASCTTQGIICVEGNPVVAVLIAASEPLSIQMNRNSAPIDFTQYIDMNNSDTDLYNFVSRFPVGQTCSVDVNKPDRCFNDQVVSITYNDWKNAMESRVKQDENYPALCAGTLSTNHWLSRNGWSFLCGS